MNGIGQLGVSALIFWDWYKALPNNCPQNGEIYSKQPCEDSRPSRKSKHAITRFLEVQVVSSPTLDDIIEQIPVSHPKDDSKQILLSFGNGW